jgi:hypothetical protein
VIHPLPPRSSVQAALSEALSGGWPRVAFSVVDAAAAGLGCPASVVWPELGCMLTDGRLEAVRRGMVRKGRR